MSTDDSDIDMALASRLRTERLKRDWSMQELADNAGISKAMVGRMEKGDVSPTANLLSKVANAFGLTLSKLLARTENAQGDFLAHAEQEVWVDPETQYVRRLVSPPGARGSDLTEVTLPGMSSVRFDKQSNAISCQQIVVLEGVLNFEGERKHFQLSPGDWFLAPESGPRSFANRQSTPCRYLLISE